MIRKKVFKLLIIPILSLTSCELSLELPSEHSHIESGNILSNEVYSGNQPDCAPLSIHFLELGNKYVGDSVYIKAGQNDILIDAGSRKESATTITNYVDNFCEDGKLEYVIATHAHQDHIAGFVGSGTNPGIFSNYDIDTLIDFPKTDVDTQIYKSYKERRDDLISYGTKHYTALECYNNENGAKRTYNLGENLTLNILYQKYYEEKASSENNYSVCILISQNDNHFLFTGDLEASGEESLVMSNSLPHVKVFKGGHHGSGTSNTDMLLNVITPENICICTCAGTPEYTTNSLNQFPYQEVIVRFAKHTENIYVTSQIDLEKSTKDTYYTKSMNGNIMVYSTSSTFSINCSNNNLKLKDTEWFKNYRSWPEIIV